MQLPIPTDSDANISDQHAPAQSRIGNWANYSEPPTLIAAPVAMRDPDGRLAMWLE